MKTTVFKKLAVTAVAVIVMAMGAFAQEVQTWDCGMTPETVTATLSEGTLTISGTGAMADYINVNNPPWYSSRNSITNVVIEEGVTSIGYGAFIICTDLNSVTMPNSVTSIGDYAFIGCTGLTSITIPNSVTSIENDAFHGCTGLTSITIPNSVTSIGDAAFAGCKNLTNIDVSSGNTAYSSVDGVLFNKAKDILLRYPEGKQGAYIIPNSVTSIGGHAFFGCNNLTSATIGNSVTSIGGEAFSSFYSTGLTSIDVDNGNSRYSSVDGVLFNKAQDTLWIYPKGKPGAYSIPNSVTFIARDGFLRCTGLTSITIPNSVTSIGTDAFSGCTGLTSVTIPNSVTSIGSSAFSGCTGLTSVTIPNSVTSIGGGAFWGCAGLTSVTIPNSVTSIGGAAFAHCTGLTSVTISNSVTSIGLAFRGCTGLTSVTSLAVVPPNIDTNNPVFEGVPISSACLYVPQTVIEAYKSADEWKDFSCIQAVDGALNVTFNSQGGSSVSSQYVLQSTVAGKPTPTREGYTFGGWYKEAACTTPWNFTNDLVTSDITLYAKWTINTYEVTFSAGSNGAISATVDGSAITSGTSVQYGKSVVFTATPAEGYSVSEWILYGSTVSGNATNTYTYTLTRETLYTNRVSVLFAKTVSVLESDRVIPQSKPPEEATVIAPMVILAGEFTAGPNPVSRQSGSVKFYRQGKRVANCELQIYDATGNVINKVKINDKAIGTQARRQVGTWNLCDRNGRTVPEGTYLVKSVVKVDGKSEKVSVILSVR